MFLKNLHKEVQESELQGFFKEFGLLQVRLPRDDNGTHRGMFHAPAHYRRTLNAERKAQEKHAMDRIRQGDYDAEFPKWKRDADWLWF